MTKLRHFENEVFLNLLLTLRNLITARGQSEYGVARQLKPRSPQVSVVTFQNIKNSFVVIVAWSRVPSILIA